jgi:sirohydrochlorin ferrochelatase
LRLRRRLAATPAQPLLLVVHGRAGGEIPGELADLAVALEERRGAPVGIQALTAAAPPQAASLLRSGRGLTLVPLLLLPGGHVRHDLPAIVQHWRRHTPVQRLPFLGAWPSWQRALQAELEAVAGAAAAGTQQEPPLLLHHPVEGRLAGRFLAQLEQAVAGRCLATPYSAEHLAELELTLTAPALPLALASNRLTDRLFSRVGPPLLQRPGLRRLLLDALEALP